MPSLRLVNAINIESRISPLDSETFRDNGGKILNNLDNS